jgi:Toprim domain
MQSPTQSPFIKNYEFNYPQTNSIFTVTCVSGHLTAGDFNEIYRKWNSCDAFQLFDAPVEFTVDKDKKAIEDNLLAQARRADTLMIWTDCDREGEHIGLEITRVCKKAKRNIVVKRARFSAIIAQFVRIPYIDSIFDKSPDKSIMLHNTRWNLIVHRPLRSKQGLFLTSKSVLLSPGCKHRYFRAVLANWQKENISCLMVSFVASLGWTSVIEYVSQKVPANFPLLVS